MPETEEKLLSTTYPVLSLGPKVLTLDLSPWHQHLSPLLVLQHILNK